MIHIFKILLICLGFWNFSFGEDKYKTQVYTCNMKTNDGKMQIMLTESDNNIMKFEDGNGWKQDYKFVGRDREDKSILHFKNLNHTRSKFLLTIPKNKKSEFALYYDDKFMTGCVMSVSIIN